MSTPVPLTISPEAAEYIANHGLQQPFQQMLDELPKRMAAVHAIKVGLEWQYDEAEMRVICDVTREHPGLADDPTDREWGMWILTAFPPDVFRHFSFLPAYVPNAGKSVS
jgi:hypothetical protein